MTEAQLEFLRPLLPVICAGSFTLLGIILKAVIEYKITQLPKPPPMLEKDSLEKQQPKKPVGALILAGGVVIFFAVFWIIRPPTPRVDLVLTEWRGTPIVNPPSFVQFTPTYTLTLELRSDGRDLQGCQWDIQPEPKTAPRQDDCRIEFYPATDQQTVVMVRAPADPKPIAKTLTLDPK